MATKQNPSFSALLPIFLFFLLLLHKANSSDSLSFNFANFGPDVVNDIIFQGDAIQSKGTIQLTKTDESGNPLDSSAGRVLYSAPVHLWEETTGRLASFYTSFTFVITPQNGNEADGITFFIAPPDSPIPSGSSGGYLALFNSDTDNALNTSLKGLINQVVAVEFDTFSNEWDPNFPHIGIDVNSIQSVATTAWGINDVPEGWVATAAIKYDSVSKILSASVSYPNGAEATVSAVVDLRSVVPEWVRVGFSGSTGGRVETNNVLSWSFTSYLDGNRKKNKRFERNVVVNKIKKIYSAAA